MVIKYVLVSKESYLIINKEMDKKKRLINAN